MQSFSRQTGSLNCVRFSLYTDEEIRKLSVKCIRNPQTFDHFGNPTYGGLYDPALGPADRDDVCTTCGQGSMYCPGHFGHIELKLPVYHPLFMKLLVTILRSTCFHCHKVDVEKAAICLLQSQMKALDYGLLAVASDLETIAHSAKFDAHGSNIKREDVVIAAVQDYLKESLKNIENKRESRKTNNAKNVTELRNRIIKNFMKKHLLFRAKKCQHCDAPRRSVRIEYNSKIYLKGLSSKQAISWENVSRLSKSNANISSAAATANSSFLCDDDFGNEDFDNKENILEEKPSVFANPPTISESVNEDTDDTVISAQQVHITPLEVQKHLHQVWQNDEALLNVLLGSYSTPTATKRKSSPQMFLLNVIPVPPARFRPLSVMGDKKFDNPQTVNLNKILDDCQVLQMCFDQMKEVPNSDTVINGDPIPANSTNTLAKYDRIPGASPKEKLQNTWVRLQNDVNSFMDSDLDKLNTTKTSGIKQLLEKKEGLFRKHMMGKRVNYAARSVISPDPYINTDQIGIPEVFAKKLTYPQPVTPWNVKELRQAVINGPNIHPGANVIENEDGKKTLLSGADHNQRKALAKRLLTPSNSSLPLCQSKKVYRHLKDGDILLLNRQPTLHKPSIMAHKARVLPGEKTIRLHYANCKAYNADFDGDEMNAHFPQNELARSEAYGIASTNFQYLIPKDGKPVSGLIQDHMVSGVSLTMRGRFFDKLDYQQLVYCSLASITNRRFELLKPTIIKPVELWTGKQVISTILLNIVPNKSSRLNLTGESKISSKSFVNGTPSLKSKGLDLNSMCESQVVIRNGELLCGVLDKAHYGSTPFSLVHCCYELYGGVVSSLLLSALARVFTAFLQMRGFTLGVEDILVRPIADCERMRIIKDKRGCGHEVATEALGLPTDTETEMLVKRFQTAHHSRDDSDMKVLDLKMKRKTDEVQDKINKQCIPFGLLKRFPDNNLQLMVQSGAKGSVVNCMQISCLLGQIELEGRRPPLMISGRSLPSFRPYDPSPRAGGFVDGRFLTGIRPQEYFFHCMAGREGLVDTAVKTSRSGYLQRCLIKHLEGLHVGYDLTVRDSDGSIVQFCYGEDGLDVLKTAFLSTKQFPFMVSNYKALIAQLKPRSANDLLDSVSAEKAQRKVYRWMKKHKRSPSDKSPRISPLNCFLEEFDVGFTSSMIKKEDLWMVNKDIISAWRSVSPQRRRKYKPCLSMPPDPVLSKMSPSCHVGAVSEKFHSSVRNYIMSNPDGCLTDQPELYPKKLSAEKFQLLMNLKALRSLVEPGEGVGLLAAQSIGEPSTQMTLNTFHFAGRGEMNVTLGIPRLREILMTASANIKTPTMEAPLISGEDALQLAKNLKMKFTKVTLSQVLESVEVWETLSSRETGTRGRVYRVRFQFLPQEAYEGDFFVTPESILAYMETKFFKSLASTITRVINAAEKESLLRTARDKADGDDENEATENSTDNSAERKYDDDDDNADLSEEEADMDGGAAGEKYQQRREQQASYEAPDEEEALLNSYLKENDESEDEDNASQVPGWLKQEGDVPMDEVESFPPAKAHPKYKKRIAKVMMNIPNVVSYCFDRQSQEWCEVSFRFPVLGCKVMLTTLVEKLAAQSVIYEIPGISRSFLAESKDKVNVDKPSMFKTEGVNLKVLWSHPNVLQVNKIYTNDTHQVANTYGIEAAGRVIATEVKNVFGAYGIQVDPRHVTLVADYMTYEGSIKAFNRIGLESNASPFQKMSFETTMHFLRGATISGANEQLSSPSSRLVVGRVVNGGTGCFDLKLPLC